jgi:hypothetical protein
MLVRNEANRRGRTGSMVRGLQIPEHGTQVIRFEIVARRDLPTPFKAVWSVALFSKAGQARVVVALRLGSPVGIGIRVRHTGCALS